VTVVDELRVRQMLDRLDSGAAADLRDTARFRNLLVHGYAKVDDTRVVEILRDRVDDLAAFRIALARAASG
jgi:uncharacterized protein YutE (UPF0331/DUF86 family)